MALPDFSMRQLLEAGVHFGHQKHRWNPRMGEYIFGVRNNIHIIDLAKTVPLLHQALKAVSDTVANGGRVLFVGTKRQAQDPIADAAKRSAQYYVNARWLGGMLTNWKTISNSITRLRELEEKLNTEGHGLTKKELLTLERQREKLERNLGGIKDMGGVPNMLFVVDSGREAIAIQEANNLNIPVAAILDSNSDPTGVSYPVPGNDDAGRALSLYCDLIARAAIDGISRTQGSSDFDAGAMETPLAEAALEDVATAPVEVSAAPPVAEPEIVAVASDTAVKIAGEGIVAVEAGAEYEQADESSERLTFTPPEGDEDNLKNIAGLGPAMERKLKEVGLMTYAQIATLTAEQAVQLDEELKLGGRIDRDDWIAKAAELANR